MVGQMGNAIDTANKIDGENLLENVDLNLDELIKANGKKWTFRNKTHWESIKKKDTLNPNIDRILTKKINETLSWFKKEEIAYLIARMNGEVEWQTLITKEILINLITKEINKTTTITEALKKIFKELLAPTHKLFKIDSTIKQSFTKKIIESIDFHNQYNKIILKSSHQNKDKIDLDRILRTNKDTLTKIFEKKLESQSGLILILGKLINEKLEKLDENDQDLDPYLNQFIKEVLNELKKEWINYESKKQ